MREVDWVGAVCGWPLRSGQRLSGSISKKQVERARRYAEQEQVDDAVSFTVADFCDTGLPDASFDVVWAVECVCHSDERDRFFEEAYRVLRENGRLVVTDGFRTDEPLAAVASHIPFIPDTVKHIPGSAYHQYELITDGVFKYRIVTARKP